MKISNFKKILFEIVKEELLQKEVNYTTDITTGKPVISVGAPNSQARFKVENPLQDIDKQIYNKLKELKSFKITDYIGLRIMTHQLKNCLEKLKQHGLIEFDGITAKLIPTSSLEGVGAGNPMKDPKHVKGDRWTVKFGSEDDLKKHGDTEISKIDESSIKEHEVKNLIKELIQEMWDNNLKENESDSLEGVYHMDYIHDKKTYDEYQKTYEEGLKAASHNIPREWNPYKRRLGSLEKTQFNGWNQGWDLWEVSNNSDIDDNPM